MGWRVRRNKDPVPMVDIVVAVGDVETSRSAQSPQNMGLAGLVLPGDVGEESLAAGYVGVKDLLGGNAEDFEGGCFLSAEAINAVSHHLHSARSTIGRNKGKFDIVESLASGWK